MISRTENHKRFVQTRDKNIKIEYIPVVFQSLLEGFITLPFQEKGLLFCAKGFIILRWRVYYYTLKSLLFYAVGFITLPFHEKGLLFYAVGFITLRFQENGLLFYVFG